MNKSFEGGRGDAVDFNALAGRVDNSLDVDGVALDQSLLALGASSEQDQVSGRKDSSVGVDFLHLHGSCVAGEIGVLAVLEDSSGVDDGAD
jgi:hypothetical protein